jgi:Protein of unknown function (DUF732)
MVLRTGMVGMGVLAAAALGVAPVANAIPTPACLQSPAPGCGRHAFLTDVTAAGITNVDGQSVELAQGIDLCDLMNEGFSGDLMASDFARMHPELGPDGARQMVNIAIRDLCPWNH